MDFLIPFLGLAIGYILKSVIVKVLSELLQNSNIKTNYLSVFIYALCFWISYISFGLNINFLRAATLSSLLVIISVVDLNTRIIPDSMVIITLVSGIIFSLAGYFSFMDSILGMLCGGGILFILALVPNSLGGGDIKLMFALGSYLGVTKTLWAIMLAFAAASIISLLLLIFKAAGRKDHIPFGPFLALGSFISLMISI